MTEEADRAGSAIENPGASADPVAVALALGGASQAQADAFLKKQEAFIDEQRHHLRRQYTQLDLSIWQQRLGVLLRLATAAMGLAIAAGLGFMVWDASRSNDLLIEPFSVPPDLASRGLTGEVVSAKLLDRLVAMQAQTSSQRAPKTYANSWDEKGIKLDIPESGISLTEMDHFLRKKLGHDMHVSGEVVRNASGVSLTARAGLNGAESVTGPDSSTDELVQRLAESVYLMTQPYRYGVYLADNGRLQEALPIIQSLARTGTAQDRSWAYSVWALAARDSDGLDAGLGLISRSVNVDPHLVVSRTDLARFYVEKGLPERGLRENMEIVALSTPGAQQSILPRFIPAIRQAAQAQVDLLLGDFHDAAQEQAAVTQSGLPGHWGLSADLAEAQAGEHDLTKARATMVDPVQDSGLAPGASVLYRIRVAVVIASQAQDWAAVVRSGNVPASQLEKYPGQRKDLLTTVVPFIAYAEAMRGDVTTAEARISTTPEDCYLCLRMRARIAELKGDHDRTSFWLTRAVQQAPSIPFAYADWGQALLARGQPDAAIEKFKLANQKGPHFADPLEGWGEALMANAVRKHRIGQDDCSCLRNASSRNMTRRPPPIPLPRASPSAGHLRRSTARLSPFCVTSACTCTNNSVICANSCA
jgi:tetratricopeptide (TPR) repeat protein